MASEARPAGGGENGEHAIDAPDQAARGEAPSATPKRTPGTMLGRWISPRTALYLAGGIITLLVIAAAGTYVWKEWVVRSMERRFAAERSQISTAQQQALDIQARDMLRLAARPLAWAVRAELLRGNVAQVDDYFREFVRERGINSILLVGPDGKVQIATNRKLETQPAAALVSKPLLDAADATIEETAGIIRLAVPVMGFDRRLGLLVLEYEPAARR